MVFDAVLREDPAGAYPKMDFDSREVYRKQVSRIARYADCTETEVARAAHQHGEGRVSSRPSPIRACTCAAPMWAITSSTRDSQDLQGTHRIPSHGSSIACAHGLRRNADDFYIGGIEVLTVFLIAAILLPLIPELLDLRRPDRRLSHAADSRHPGRGGSGQQHHLFPVPSAAAAQTRSHAMGFPPNPAPGRGAHAAAERKAGAGAGRRIWKCAAWPIPIRICISRCSPICRIR